MSPGDRSDPARADAATACDVLVVDDEPVIGEAIRRVLAAHGLRVAVAPDIASARAHPGLARCRMTICDLMLPDGFGSDLVRDLRARRPDLPVVVITGYATAASAVAARQAGAEGFLPKPFDEDELLAVVRRVLPDNLDVPECSDGSGLLAPPREEKRS